MSFGALIGRLGLDNTGFARGLKQAEVMADKAGAKIRKDFTSKMGGWFGAGTGLFALKSFTDRVGHLKDFSEQMDVTTTEAQKLDMAGRDDGLTLDKWGMALTKVGDIREKAARGDKDAIATLQRFKVNMDQATDAGVRNIVILEQIGAAVREMNLNTGDRQALKEIFGGRSGEKFAAALGNVDKRRMFISEQEIKDIDQAKKNLEGLWLKAQALGAPVIGMQADILNKPGGAISEFLKTFTALGSIQAIGGAINNFRRRGFRGHGASGSWGEPAAPGSLAPNAEALRVEAEAAEAYTKLYEIMAKNRQANLSASQKELELRRQINNELVAASEYADGEAEKAMHLARAEELRGQLTGLTRKGSGRMKGDSLTSVGNFIAPTRRETMTIEAELRAIKTNTARIAAKRGIDWE